MIETISLHHVMPHAFAGETMAPSEVWGVDLCLEKGLSYQIEAESGRGKTSLCAYLYGMRNDYDGQIVHLDAQGNTLPLGQNAVLDAVRQRSLAMLFQDLRLFTELTPVENVMLKNQLTEYATGAEIRGWLEAVGLGDRMDRPCGRISIGQQQRVAFVRMLCQPADFCILDEPVSHLDQSNAAIMQQLLKEKQQRDGCGVIVTSIGYTLPYDYDKTLKL